MALVLDIAVGERVWIDGTLVTMEMKSGRKARISIQGSAKVVLERPDNGKKKKEEANGPTAE